MPPKKKDPGSVRTAGELMYAALCALPGGVSNVALDDEAYTELACYVTKGIPEDVCLIGVDATQMRIKGVLIRRGPK